MVVSLRKDRMRSWTERYSCSDEPPWKSVRPQPWISNASPVNTAL